MKKFRTNGAIGALLDEYEKAIAELKILISTISPTELTHIVDTKTTDKDCRSIETILIHVIRAGLNYVVSIRNHQGEKLKPVTSALFQTTTDFCTGLDKMFSSAESMFNDYPEIALEEQHEDNKIHVSWGQRYDVEQLMEHAIVHILRHRRQIERFLLKINAS